MRLNKGYVVVLTTEDHARLAGELATMQLEVLQGGPWATAVGILCAIVENSVDTDLSHEEDQNERIMAYED